MTDVRVGCGFDAHAFEDGAPLVLGGVRIEHTFYIMSAEQQMCRRSSIGRAAVL